MDKFWETLSSLGATFGNVEIAKAQAEANRLEQYPTINDPAYQNYLVAQQAKAQQDAINSSAIPASFVVPGLIGLGVLLMMRGK